MFYNVSDMEIIPKRKRKKESSKEREGRDTDITRLSTYYNISRATKINEGLTSVQPVTWLPKLLR